MLCNLMSIRLMHPLAGSMAVGLCGQATAEWADNLSEGSQFCTRCEPLVILGAGDSYPFIYGRLCKIFWGLGSPRGCCEGQVHYPPPHDRRIFPRKICQETQRCIVRIYTIRCSNFAVRIQIPGLWSADGHGAIRGTPIHRHQLICCELVFNPLLRSWIMVCLSSHCPLAAVGYDYRMD
ncbi:hypothetical protein SCLCIDRAFT_704439 [Scleroderma citrinum Foug A]|uniref:Secreted protein n=1 Tax=Scleroderma citrinum Foug A TaxID=1036808 RepID=A0A0C3E9L5_9AGAM|nr:hypothetical protein SCLCIDRAFT_704439 [Scleroderma citrinum Foug A]